MKKATLLLAAAGLFVLASCDTKECRCYEYNGTRWVKKYTSTFTGTRCSELNTNTYVCDEMTDPEIDPNDIGGDTKKLKVEN